MQDQRISKVFGKPAQTLAVWSQKIAPQAVKSLTSKPFVFALTQKIIIDFHKTKEIFDWRSSAETW